MSDTYTNAPLRNMDHSPRFTLPTRFSTSDLSRWAEFCNHAFVPLEVEGKGSPSFQGMMETVASEHSSATVITANAHGVVRTSQLVAEAISADPMLKFTFQLEGEGELIQDGRQTTVRPGDIAIYDTSRPYTLDFSADFQSLVLMIPRHQFNLSKADLESLMAVALRHDSSIGQLVGPLLKQVAAQPMLYGAATEGRLAKNITCLLGTILRLMLDIRVQQSGDKEANLRTRIYSFIEAHLSDNRLNPPTIAAAHHISVRRLYRIFEDEPASVAQTIRDLRVERVRQDLCNPDLQMSTLHLLAQKWCFSNTPHLSRVFKEAFGITPQTYRNACQNHLLIPEKATAKE